MTQPSLGSSGPSRWSSMRKLWPCRREHLWLAGRFGSLCAASTWKALKINTGLEARAEGERHGLARAALDPQPDREAAVELDVEAGVGAAAFRVLEARVAAHRARARDLAHHVAGERARRELQRLEAVAQPEAERAFAEADRGLVGGRADRAALPLAQVARLDVVRQRVHEQALLDAAEHAEYVARDVVVGDQGLGRRAQHRQAEGDAAVEPLVPHLRVVDRQARVREVLVHA